MRFDIPKDLYNVYWPTGIYMKLFFPYRWSVFPFKELDELVPKSGKIVDLGCGHGIFSNYLAFTSNEREVIGIDINPSRIEFANKTKQFKKTTMNTTFILEDIIESKITDADCFTLIDFIHHLPSVEAQERILKKCSELLPSGSKLVIADIDISLKAKYYFGKFVELIMYPDMKTTYRPIVETIKYIESIGFRVDSHPIDKGFPYASILLNCTKI